MESIIRKAVRTIALALVICATGGAWAEYVAGWDFKSLGGGTAWNTFATSMQSEGTDMFSGEEKTVANDAPVSWDAPSGDKSFTLHATVSNIPSGAVPLICWTVPDSSVEVIIGKTANDSNGFATIRNSWANSSSTTTYSAAGQAFSWKADTGEHTLTVVYRAVTSSYTRFYLDGVLITEVSGLLWNDKAHGKIIFGGVTLDGSNTYDGAEATGMVVKRAYYRQGVQYNPNTKTGTLVSNGYTLNLNGCVINSDGTLSIMGAPNKGPTVTFANGDDFYNSKTLSVVMEVDGAPIASSDAMLVNFTYGTNKIGLRTNNGTLYQSWNGESSNYGTYAWVPGKRQTITFTADRASDATRGTRTIIDGTEVITNVQSLCAGETFRSVQIGSYYNGSAYSKVARGLRIYSIKLYTTKLDASGAATAATDVIISDGANVAASAGMNGLQYCGTGFTTGFTIDLAGQTVALGTYPGTSGTITVNDSVGGGSATLTIPEDFTGSFAGSGKLSVTAPSSILPSSGGAALPSTVTIPDASGTVIAADSVTIGNSGIQMAYTTQPITLMMKVANIPSTASVLAGLELSGKDAEIVPTRTSTGFQNGWVSTSGGNFGNNSGTDWGAASTTSVASGEHWLTVAYASDTDNYGTRSYLDGEGVACTTDPNGLRWTSGALTAVTVGGSKARVNNYTASTGMIIKDVQIYSGKLTAVQIAKAEAAAAAGWMPDDATGLAWSNSEGGALPGHTAVTAIGSFTINSDGSLDLSGITQAMVSSGGSVDLSKASGLTAVSVLSGGTATLGLQRPAQVVVMDGGTLNLTAGTMSDIITGYTPTATLTTQSAAMFAGTVTLDGQTVTPVIDGATVTLTGTYVAGNPSYTGSSYWWDYEFNGNGNNIGSDSTELQYDTSRPTSGGNSLAKVWENGTGTVIEDYTASVSGNQMVYLLARPWRHVVDGYPSEFTAVMYCKAGTTANASLVCFGSKAPQVGDTSVKRLIALTTGGNPSSGQMRLVLIDPTLSGDDRVVDLVEGGFRLDNITTANHLYAFTVQTVDGVSHISVYADGELLTTYIADSIITLGTGFQIGSIHGAIESWMGLSYLSEGDNNNQVSADTATMDFLRVSNTALTSEAIKALAKEYPYVSPNGIATRVIDANGTWSDSENTPWSQKTLNQDGSSTTTDQAAPNANTVVDVIATADATLTMNLDSSVSYEKLTFEGSGAITIAKGGTAPTVTTRTYIKTDTTIPVDAFASLGAITVDAGKTLTLIPPEDTFNKGIALGIGGSSSSIVTGTATLRTGASVVLDSDMVAQYASYGFNLSLTTNEAMQYVLIVERADGVVKLTQRTQGTVTATMAPAELAQAYADSMLLPDVPATIPQDFTGSVIIQNLHNTDPFTVATVFEGGAVPVTINATSAPVVLTGDSTFGGAVSGTATLTISGDITLASGGSIANTIAGDGTLTFEALPASALSFGEWTGTVVLPADQAFGGQKFDDYGIAGSTVRLQGENTGWFNYGTANDTPNRAPVATTVEIPADASLTVTGWEASFANTFNVLKGAGTFAVDIASAIDIPYSDYSRYFLLKDVSEFTGSLSVTGAGIAIGASKPAYTTTGGKIILTTSATIATGKTWTATDGIVLANSDATLTNTDGELDSAPTTNVSRSRVVSSTSAGTTTYSVEVIPGTIFSVY